jgi:hypothetical protein
MAEKPPSDYTLDQLRDWLQPRLEQPGGTTCPCCGQHAQAYKRTITGPMVAVMANMLDAAREKGASDAWVHLAHVEQKSRDTATLRYWGLIREHGEKRGWWQVTEDGQNFLAGQYKVPKYAHVYRNKVYAHTGEPIGVRDVEPKFNFDAVVRGLPESEQLPMGEE